MGTIYGQVTDKYHQPVAGATVGVMNRDFEMLYQTLTDADGKYRLELPDGAYPFLIAVKDYTVQNLEYWCNAISLQGQLELHCQIDTLEVYGLHVFAVKGAFPALTVYFRPMSLVKYLAKEQDIAPDLTEDSLTCLVNGEPCPLLLMNQVQEYSQDGTLGAYLIQIARPQTLAQRNKLDLIVKDADGNAGMASLFFEREEL